MLAITPSVRNLLILNILFFFIDSSVFKLSPIFALRPVMADAFIPFQFVTYMFLHAGFTHLFGNMFGLIMFGPLLERMWGSKKFLFFYFFTGIGAGLLYSAIGYFENMQLREAVELYLQNPTPDELSTFFHRYSGTLNEQGINFLNSFEEKSANPTYIQDSINYVNGYYQAVVNGPNARMVGASGSIFGILMAFGLLFPNTELMLLFVPFPIKAKYFVAMYGLYEIYAAIENAPSDNVAHFAHIGGMLFAYILLRYWGKQKTNFY